MAHGTTLREIAGTTTGKCRPRSSAGEVNCTTRLDMGTAAARTIMTIMIVIIMIIAAERLNR
jgi:hypothetical protein